MVKTKNFSTDMGSLAFQNVYDYLELYDNITIPAGIVETKLDDMPAAVRYNYDNFINQAEALSNTALDMIVFWISAALVQAQDIHEAMHMDEILGGRLGDLGVIPRAVDMALARVNKIKGVETARN